ncbi:S8 family serine peptidase [Patiriisocius sp. Uisw_017]|jgi:hypothetical protein|uniref:S8 family serine peptidase n=1 Tax=Patiriisocius sp. Uisw_017 TaxID=3230968 RepID=UPI0039EB8A81
MKKNRVLGLFFVVVVSFSSFSQTEAQRQKISNSYNIEKLNLLENELREQFETKQQRAFALASQNGWPLEYATANGGNALLVDIFPDGTPKYYQTENKEAAITTRTDRVHSGGIAGLNLNGENMTIGFWDAGPVRATHELFSGRVTLVENTGNVSNHATHVAGTIIGNGNVVGGNAKGMAPEAALLAYNFNDDEPEMTNAAANGMLISNHSYGIDPSGTPLWYLGYYDSNARNIDNIIYNAPFYLPICSAGNARTSGENPADGGYDYLNHYSVAKNNLVVAATFEVLEYQQPSDVEMSTFSSWGPTDDGRIKPDISAKGVAMFSSSGAADGQYTVLTGTSMASANVSGSLLLLQQHYNELNSEFMQASTLRALVLHTADEAGTTPGPDYRFGWGLLNTEKAAQVISNNGTNAIIIEEIITPFDDYTFSFTSDGTSDYTATIAWTDPAGDLLPSGIEDVSTPRLKNDLDLRISIDGGETFLPWVLEVANPTAEATRGDNVVDNIEKIETILPAAGDYTVRVSHKGNTLVNNEQSFSLVLTSSNSVLSVTNNLIENLVMYPNPANSKLYINASETIESIRVYTVQGKTVKDIHVASKNNVVDIQNLGTGIYFVKVVSKNKTEVIRLLKE